MKLETYLLILAWIGLPLSVLTIAASIYTVATNFRYKLNGRFVIWWIVLLTALGYILCH